MFCSGLIKFRRGHPLLGQKDFLSPEDITWHEDTWDNPESKFLAFSLHDRYSRTMCTRNCNYRCPGQHQPLAGSCACSSCVRHIR